MAYGLLLPIDCDSANVGETLFLAKLLFYQTLKFIFTIICPYN